MLKHYNKISTRLYYTSELLNTRIARVQNEYADNFTSLFYNFRDLKKKIVRLMKLLGKSKNVSKKYRPNTICYRNVTRVNIVRSLLLCIVKNDSLNLLDLNVLNVSRKKRIFQPIK